VVQVSEKLSRLRRFLLSEGADLYYIPGTDPHQDEYVPAHWQHRVWISQFTGSAGDVFVGQAQAWLWTDGRYALQASQDLDSKCFQIVLSGQGRPTMRQWLTSQGQRLRFAVDPSVISISVAEELRQTLAETDGELVFVDNWVDALWTDRPPLELKSLKLHPLKYTGQTTADKLIKLRDWMREQGMEAYALNTLDSIAWLFNIRGADIPYNPLVISYALVTLDAAFLCTDTKVSKEDAEVLLESGVTVAPYADFMTLLQSQAGQIAMYPGEATVAMWNAPRVGKPMRVSSPISLWKACKNSVEIQGSRIAHEQDALALIRWMHWLTTHWRGLDEVSVTDRLTEFRQQGRHYCGDSFPAIAGFGENGAVVHYRASSETALSIQDTAPFLIDSGGQYLEGTTDVTRVLHLGTPTARQRRDYTLVLKGHLRLRHTRFPKGTVGAHLDALARQFLWQHGLDYDHGTGHGVGSYLCVHEGPARISPGLIKVPLQPGMILSNEPGVYLACRYGIRIENLCVVVPVISAEDSEVGREFYGFEDLTLVPYQRKLIDICLLTAEEIGWIDQYHRRIWDTLSDRLSGGAREWLNQETAPLQ